METLKLIKNIEKLDFIQFQKEWDFIKSQSTENERQLLLIEILENHYHKANFSFFVKVFDEILKIKTSLDFSIDHWAPSLLSLAVQYSSKIIFQYFVRKGANVNFIGDRFFNLTAIEISLQSDAEHEDRFQTCLDFANTKYCDMFTCDYHFSPPWNNIEERRQNENAEEIISISKRHYFDLVEQAIYLQDLIHLDRVRDYIIGLGGKTYLEL